jgi:hypothetical protein
MQGQVKGWNVDVGEVGVDLLESADIGELGLVT